MTNLSELAVTSAYFINDNFDLLKVKTNKHHFTSSCYPIANINKVHIQSVCRRLPSTKRNATPSSLFSVPSCLRQTWETGSHSQHRIGELCTSLALYFKHTREKLLFDEGKRKTLSAKNANRNMYVV